MSTRRLCSLTVVCTLAFLGLIGCTLNEISGPSTVSVGDTPVYVFKYSASGDESTWQAWLLAEIPTGWAVEGAVYMGFTAGEELCGIAAVLGSDPGVCNGDFPDVPAGYKRVWIQSDVHGSVFRGDEGVAKVRFSVGGAPGQYTLTFWPVYDTSPGDGDANCSGSARTLQVTVQSRTLTAQRGLEADAQTSGERRGDDS